MRFTYLKLENWRNFRSVDLPLQRRLFLVGPNASGKSNLLDALRFLRDIATPEGGFQSAVTSRGGVSQIRCLHARQSPDVVVEAGIRLDEDEWVYRLEFGQDKQRRPIVKRERVLKNDESIIERPGEEDEDDPSRLTQTHLEQVFANQSFREVASFLARLRYLHVVPQLIRELDRSGSRSNDPLGSDLLEQIASTPTRTRQARLRKIKEALKVAVPQLSELELERDVRGVPHLRGLYRHWRPKAGWQSEEHFSDGTLRLVGLLWVLLDGKEPLLLEEPELSLHAAVVRQIPTLMYRAGRNNGRQVLISTHSSELLLDESIAPEEVALLLPAENGTEVQLASSKAEVRALIETGLSLGEVVMQETAPREIHQLSLFDG